MPDTDCIPLGQVADPHLTRLCGRALDLDAPDAADVLRRLASPPAGRRAHALVAGRDGLLLASVDDRDAAVGHLDLIVVAADARRRGVGRALVGAAEDRLAADGVREVRWAGNPPCYGWPGIDVGYTPAICTAESLGYERYGTAQNVAADLDALDLDMTADERRLTAAGAHLHRCVAGADALAVTMIEWIRTTWNSTWATEAAAALDAGRPGACHIAVRDGAVIGFAAWGANRAGWFGPMGTDPAARGLGVGGVLLRRCLADQRAAGVRRSQIGWVGPIGFYSRAVGARIDRIFWLYRKEVHPGGGKADRLLNY